MSETVLIIEDDMDFASSLKIRLSEEEVSTSIEIRDNFDTGLSDIHSLKPSVVVLDLYQGEPTKGEDTGRRVWQHVRERVFVPLVFASASRQEDLVTFAETHPLVSYVQKTSQEAADLIINRVRHFLPFGKAINEIRSSLCEDAEQAAQKALVETAPHTLTHNTSVYDCHSLLKTAARRRLAAHMRQKAQEEHGNIFAWEQYVYPPSETSYLLTGDILRSTIGDKKSPESYRVVLTPSCDLAQGKVSNVLVGKCVPLTESFDKNNLPILPWDSKKKEDGAKSKLSSILTQSQSNGYVVLPAYSSLVPSMALSLRNLELLTITEEKTTVQSPSSEKFERLISLDSPFREQLGWAYLQIAGRPGMPDRDLESWIGDIFKSVQNGVKTENDRSN